MRHLIISQHTYFATNWQQYFRFLFLKFTKKNHFFCKFLQTVLVRTVKRTKIPQKRHWNRKRHSRLKTTQMSLHKKLELKFAQQHLGKIFVISLIFRKKKLLLAGRFAIRQAFTRDPPKLPSWAHFVCCRYKSICENPSAYVTENGHTGTDTIPKKSRLSQMRQKGKNR